jgi:hypothetical protein
MRGGSCCGWRPDGSWRGSGNDLAKEDPVVQSNSRTALRLSDAEPHNASGLRLQSNVLIAERVDVTGVVYGSIPTPALICAACFDPIGDSFYLLQLATGFECLGGRDRWEESGIQDQI